MNAAEQMLALIYLPLLNWRAGWGTGRRFHELLRSERWPRERLDDLQRAKLSDRLAAAVREVPYYRNHGAYAAADRAGSAGKILRRLPILRRSDIQRAGRDMLGPGHVRAQRSRTGGTTGAPLEVWRDAATRTMAEAALWRGKSWAGIRPWDKAVSVRGMGKASVLGRLRMRLLRKWVVEAFQPAPDQRRRIRDLIGRIRPVSVEGYVTDLLDLARGQDISAAGIRTVLTTGEMLYAHQKTELEQAFGAPVHSYYGCNEIAALAFECERGMRHVTDEHVVLEAVNADGEPVWDEPGRLLVTDLDNRAMPLIRYELGDIGVLSREPCACGRAHRVLKELVGRQQESIRNETGERLSATFFAGRFRNLRHVGRLQLVQEDVRSVEILYDGDEADAALELRDIVHEIRSRLGEEMKIRATRVDAIPLTARGKRPLIRGMKD